MRMLNYFPLWVCFGFVVVLGSQPPEYKLSKLCKGGDATVTTSALLKADKMELKSGVTCSVRVFAFFHKDYHTDKVRLELLSLDIPDCHKGYLQLFDGFEGENTTLSGKICGDFKFQEKKFISRKTDHISVIVHSYKDQHVSLKLLITATSKEPDSTDFVCDNVWAVSDTLVCDGYDNCGDWSDERSRLCPYDLALWRWTTIVIFVLCWVLSVAAIVVSVLLLRTFRRHRRRRRYRQQNGAAVSPIATGQPTTTTTAANYGSINCSPPPYPPPYKSATSAASVASPASFVGNASGTTSSTITITPASPATIPTDDAHASAAPATANH